MTDTDENDRTRDITVTIETEAIRGRADQRRRSRQGCREPRHSRGHERGCTTIVNANFRLRDRMKFSGDDCPLVGGHGRLPDPAAGAAAAAEWQAAAELI